MVETVYCAVRPDYFYKADYVSSLKSSLCFSSGVPRNFVQGAEGGEFQQIQLGTEDRENGDLGGASPLVRGSGGSCNLVQEISFHMVKFS